MLRPVILALALVFALGAAAAAQPSHPPAATVTVAGPGGRTVHLSAADLAQATRAHVHMNIHGQAHDFEGVALIDLLARVGAPHGEQLRGAALADVVLVSARDGYRVALSLGEIDPAMRPGASVILADRDNGAPIGADDGPFRLVVDGDARPARSARQVMRIELRTLH